MTTSKHCYIVCTDPLKILEGPFNDWGTASDVKNANYRKLDREGNVEVMSAFQFEQLCDETNYINESLEG